MTRKTLVALMALAVGAWAGMSLAEVQTQRLKEDPEHIQSWNEFAADLEALHEEQLASHEVETSSEIDGYSGMPKFYKEVEYRDAETGELLSRVQWERKNPENVHAIEVYVRDDEGRVQVDYAAAFLPHHRNAPVQTLINVHKYSDGLHAFRQFDASGARLYEFCEGEYKGEEVTIRLFSKDLTGNSFQAHKIMTSPEYEACFSGLEKNADEYLDPYEEG